MIFATRHNFKMENDGISGANYSGRTHSASISHAASTFESAFGEDFDPCLDGASQGSDLWFDVVSEVHFEQPLVVGEKFTDTEKDIISLAFRRFERFGGRSASAVGGKADHTGYITAEDFDEGPARQAFLLCYGHAWHLLGGKKDGQVKPLTPSAHRALEFYFCHNPNAMTFEDAGSAMSEEIRRDVVRLRFMYEFWLSWMILPPLPFAVTPLPGLVEDAASTAAGLEGVALAQVIWQNPGIELANAILTTQNRLRNICYECTDTELVAALNALTAEYLVSLKMLDNRATANLYLTGANPEQEIKDKSLDPDLFRRVQKSTIWWSRLFSE